MEPNKEATLCPVCYSIYDNPRILLCGHCFCFKCISQIAQGHFSFSCPTCRVNVQLGIRGVEGLPKNYALIEVIQSQCKASPTLCNEHGKFTDLFCDECDALICSKCIFDNHSGHKFRDMDTVLHERKTRLSELLEKTQLWDSEMKEKKDQIRERRQSVEKEAETQKAAFNDTFKKWLDGLDQKRMAGIEHVDNEAKGRLEIFDNHLKFLDTASLNISSLQSDIKKTLSTDAASVMQLYRSLSESHRDLEFKTDQVMKTPFVPPEDLNICILGEWIEEAIENIKPINSRQEDCCKRSMLSILEENKAVQRKFLHAQNELEQCKSRACEIQRDVQSLREENNQLQNEGRNYQDNIKCLKRKKRQKTAELEEQVKMNEALSQKYKAVVIELKKAKRGQEQRRKQIDIMQYTLAMIDKIEENSAIRTNGTTEDPILVDGDSDTSRSIAAGVCLTNCLSSANPRRELAPLIFTSHLDRVHTNYLLGDQAQWFPHTMNSSGKKNYFVKVERKKKSP